MEEITIHATITGSQTGGKPLTKEQLMAGCWRWMGKASREQGINELLSSSFDLLAKLTKKSPKAPSRRDLDRLYKNLTDIECLWFDYVDVFNDTIRDNLNGTTGKQRDSFTLSEEELAEIRANGNGDD